LLLLNYVLFSLSEYVHSMCLNLGTNTLSWTILLLSMINRTKTLLRYNIIILHTIHNMLYKFNNNIILYTHTLHQVNDSTAIYYTFDIFVTTLLQACHDCSMYNILCILYYYLIQCNKRHWIKWTRILLLLRGMFDQNT